MTSTDRTAPVERPVRAVNAIAYGIGDLYGGGSFFLVGSLAMFYLVAVVGLSPLWAGFVPGLGKVWDAVSDPVMGYISDRIKTRFGRRRVFFLVGIVPVALTFILLWVPVRAWFPGAFESQAAAFAYYFTAYLLFYTVLTMVMIPYSALSAEMSTDFRSRNRLTSTRMFFSLLSSTMAGAVSQPLVNSFEDVATGFLVMGIAFGTFYALPWIFVFMGTWELPAIHHEGEGATSIFGNFASILKNKSFRIHLVMYVCAYAAMDIILGWMLFYVTDCIRRPELFAVLLPVLVVSEVACVPVYTAISNRFGHSRAFVTGICIWGAGMAFLAIHGPGTSAALLVANVIVIGAGLSAGVIIPYNILPFVTDVDEMITRRKRAGTYSGAMTLVRKLIQGALVFPLLGVLLTAIGYRTPNQPHILVGRLNAQILQSARAMEGTIPHAEAVEKSRKIAAAAARMRGVAPQVAAVEVRAAAGSEGAAIERRAREFLAGYGPRDAAAFSSEVVRRSRSVEKAIRIKQDTGTVGKLRVLFIAAPIALLCVSALAGTRFRINGRTHRILMAEIERLKNGGSMDSADGETVKVCEELTGIEYRRLYGRDVRK